ncbi:hypothetical protein [Egicoccus sp. AB-alg6-2]|uniref:hypothetical protein n=1 Tax=Egicoccus sp. AB-alg6-2 TaxID=3242692 RepID=UPI00359D8CE8
MWEVARRPAQPHAFASLLPSTSWLVEATTHDEKRVWRAGSRGEANRLVAEVAMSLRTGGPSPEGEIDPTQAQEPPAGA